MLKRRFIVSASLVITSLCGAADLVDLSVITTKGYVTYTVPGQWKVLGVQTKPPKTAASFHIENPTDAGTQGFTNVAIMTFETDSREATSTFERVAAELRMGTTRSRHGAWQVFRQDCTQSNTCYSTRNAYRDVPGAHVMICFAWPHLPRNPARYDAQMEEAFYSLLDSVKGALGPKPKQEGEVVRRPIVR